MFLIRFEFYLLIILYNNVNNFIVRYYTLVHFTDIGGQTSHNYLTKLMDY